MDSKFQLCGVSYSVHNALDHCVVIVLADKIQESASEMLQFQKTS